MTTAAKRHVESFDRPQAALFDSPEPRIWLLVGEREAEALKAGTVPQAVQEQAQCAIDWEFTLHARTVDRRRQDKASHV